MKKEAAKEVWRASDGSKGLRPKWETEAGGDAALRQRQPAAGGSERGERRGRKETHGQSCRGVEEKTKETKETTEQHSVLFSAGESDERGTALAHCCTLGLVLQCLPFQCL